MRTSVAIFQFVLSASDEKFAEKLCGHFVEECHDDDVPMMEALPAD